ncbi:hypothetical protein LZ24_01829 [Desulfobotulus alkaliphilus]|uniref:Uncharacterized protein n=1 Tax=Desulfobotulus alkaliphilus TaxID=622671 RepID=A0A562RRX0_9BACT|nr:hypothetical protein [Desulfobotulus alkaliphilus]TWI71812.1 hypothetical protein LZ24_01829 [Desulfobotulus alkaliphilus]
MRIKMMISFFSVFVLATFAWAELNLNHGHLDAIDPHAYTVTIDGKKYRLANNVNIYKDHSQSYESITVWDLQEGSLVVFELHKSSRLGDEQITRLTWFLHVEPQ